jgi:hypothetical protein
MFAPVYDQNCNKLTFPRPIPLTNFAMKRGAERQMTKEDFKDGDVQPEARLADPDDIFGSLIPQHHILKSRPFVFIYYSVVFQSF